MDRVAFTIFGKDIYWYGIIIATALIIGVILGIREAKRRGYRSEMILDFMLIAIPICIVSARLYYVVFEWDMYAGDFMKMIAIWEGGLAIYGAVIGGVISAIIFFRWRRVPVGEILDIAAPSIILAQAIGRWGNFVNQEAHGEIINNPSWQWFPAGVQIDGIWYQATFFYESAWNLLVFIFLVLIRRKVKVRGGIFALYIACYGFGRFWIEGLRTDSLYWGPFRVSQVLSALLVIGGLAYVYIMSRRKKDITPYEGYYSSLWTQEQMDEFRANIKTIRAQEKAESAVKKADALLSKHDSANQKVKKAEEKARKAKKRLQKLDENIKISEIQAHRADDESLGVTESDKRKAQKAKERIEKLSQKSDAAKEQIEKADEQLRKAEERAEKVDIKAKKAEQEALEKSAQAKKAELEAQKAKNKAAKKETDKNEE